MSHLTDKNLSSEAKTGPQRRQTPDGCLPPFCSVIGRVPEDIMSSPANDEARQEALGDGLQDGRWNHVDP